MSDQQINVKPEIMIQLKAMEYDHRIANLEAEVAKLKAEKIADLEKMNHELIRKISEQEMAEKAETSKKKK